MRQLPITPLPRCGDGSHSDDTGDGHVIRQETAHFNPLDVADDVRRVAYGDVSRRHWQVHPGAGLRATPFPTNILNQVVPDANPVSANRLE